MDRQCSNKIVSEDYVDFLWKINDFPGDEEELGTDMCVQRIGDFYGIYYVKAEFLQRVSRLAFPYEAFPALYGLQQTEALEASSILRLQNQPVLELQGKNVILGFVDTGIDYTNACFQDSMGKTRILEIWDQTINEGTEKSEIAYGRIYDQETINLALENEDPYEIVPSRDSSGHGTYLASVAGGSYEEKTGWVGAAPLADLAVVKLKPAKAYLKQYYAVYPDAEAYQETDIMLGIQYLNKLALREKKPLVLCLGLGTNMGGHSGTSPLAGYLNILGARPGRSVVVAGGNEANKGHHFLGTLERPQGYQDVEIRVAEGEYGFLMEVWSNSPDTLSVSLRSPTGEEVPRIVYSEGNRRFDFLFEETVLYVEFLPLEARSGDQLIAIRMFRPAPGIWTLRVYGEQVTDGRFHVWLPISAFLLTETEFFASNPDTTLTEPANGEGAVSVAAYNMTNDSIDIDSGRGYTRQGRVKPDLAAPGVEVSAYGPDDRYMLVSGTSVSAAITAGAVALLLEWAVVRGNRPDISNLEVRQLLIRGAKRDPGLQYPNRSWGYGMLNLYESFRVLGRF